MNYFTLLEEYQVDVFDEALATFDGVIELHRGGWCGCVLCAVSPHDHNELGEAGA